MSGSEGSQASMAGTGTRLLAALKLGRKAIGIENDQERIDIIKYRLTHELVAQEPEAKAVSMKAAG